MPCATFLTKRIGPSCGCRSESWRRRLSGLRLRAFARQGKTTLRQSRASDAAASRPASTFVTRIDAFPEGRDSATSRGDSGDVFIGLGRLRLRRRTPVPSGRDCGRRRQEGRRHFCRRNHEEVTSRQGTILDRENYAVTRHAVTCRLRRDLAPRETPGPAFLVTLNACPRSACPSRVASQADDICAHRQQNGDTDGNNDQEEFSHCAASRRPQRKAARIVLCQQANAGAAFAEEGPPSRQAFRRSGMIAIRSPGRNSR